MSDILKDSDQLMRLITEVLYEKCRNEAFFCKEPSYPSAVLLLLGRHCDNFQEPCVILNKRSQNVRQPGDLCCPGGSLSPHIDPWIARCLSLPGFPMRTWKYLKDCQKHDPYTAKHIALFFATGLREGFEEMRLNPFGVRFLGPLTPQRLVMFQRIIYPTVGWVMRQKHFRTNWEVEKMVYIPLKHLLLSENYALYRVSFSKDFQKKFQEYPCFVYETENFSELLWGATYRIVTAFLEIAFGFKPPDSRFLPVITGNLDRNYLTGNFGRTA